MVQKMAEPTSSVIEHWCHLGRQQCPPSPLLEKCWPHSLSWECRQRVGDIFWRQNQSFWVCMPNFWWGKMTPIPKHAQRCGTSYAMRDWFVICIGPRSRGKSYLFLPTDTDQKWAKLSTLDTMKWSKFLNVNMNRGGDYRAAYYTIGVSLSLNVSDISHGYQILE